MNHFIGLYEATLDAKGRFLLPANLKKQWPEGETSMVINRGFEKTLELYPMKVWESILERLGKLNSFDPKVRKFRTLYLSGATVVELDSAGRLLIPPSLKVHAQLEKDITITSDAEKVKIWDTANYKQFLDSISDEDFSDLAFEVLGGEGV